MSDPATTQNPEWQNPEGLEDFDPMDDPKYAAFLHAYSDKLRRSTGRPPLRFGDRPAAADAPPPREPLTVTDETA